MNLNDITIDDVKKDGVERKEESPVLNESKGVLDGGSEERAEVVSSESENTAPVFNFEEKTGGKYSSFDDLWNDFQSVQSSKPESVEPEWKDEYIKKAVEYYNENGDLTPFLEATKFNPDEMSDEQVLRKKLRSQYEGLSDRAFESKFERYMDSEFDPSEDDDVREEMIKFKANKVREELKAEQQKFLNREPKPKPQQVSIEEEIKQWKEIINSDPSIQDLVKNKTFKFKYGDDEFNYEVDNPGDIIEQAVDNHKFWSNFAIERDGKPAVNLAKFAKVAQYASDPESFEKRLIEYGKSLGKSDVLDDIENPTEIRTPKRDTPDGSPTGDWRDEFFAELKKQK
jgi:hypothetical protein